MEYGFVYKKSYFCKYKALRKEYKNQVKTNDTL